MVLLLVVVVLFAVLTTVSVLGWTVDSRDPQYDLGCVAARGEAS